MRRIIALLLVATSLTGFAQTKHLNLDKKKLALQGYDPITYFLGKPEEGKKEWFTTHLGARYQFVSEDHKKKFLKDPKSFQPQYGGWCAYSIATSGEKNEIDPKTYELKDGKLYLFSKTKDSNALKDWTAENPTAMRKKADRNWSKTIKGR